jgi:hypothetical protein
MVYYAHVPKCAGSSIEDYLTERFGPLAFLNRGHRRILAPKKWSATSPQHIDVAALDLLFPQDFFDASFTVVRHPVSRLISAFTFQQARRYIPLRMGFEAWLAAGQKATSFQFDNHLRPMTDLVPEGAEVFRMEDGLGAVVPWLDELAGNQDGPREIPKSNKTDDVVWRSRTAWKEWIRSHLQAKRPTLDDRLCGEIYRLYKADYERFGYDPAGPAAMGKR